MLTLCLVGTLMIRRPCPQRQKNTSGWSSFKQDTSLRKKSCQFNLETTEPMLLKIVFYINKIPNLDHVSQKCYERVKIFT